MSNIDRRYAKYDEGVLPEEGEYGVTYLTLYSSNAGNIYDGWVWDPDAKVPESFTERTYGYRNPDYPDYCWDDEVVVDLSNAQTRQESSEFISGRITSFNTNVSSRPIVLQDIDITGLTEEEREEKATTVLFSSIPLVQDAYIQAHIEVQCKCNLSPDNTSGEMRVEAFYILNGESDRTMRPNPVHTFEVTTPNERHTLPWLYFNPALRHEDHNYIGVKLIATGGTVEIGISDDPDYGDAMITLGSAGLTGDRIESGKPVRIWIEGETLVPLGYRIDINDYMVFCEYDTGEIYVVTQMCTFNPEPGYAVEDNFYLQAWYMGLHATLRVQVALVDHIELIGNEDIHGSYTLDINDYTVIGYFENGDVWDVTDQCGYFPPMGTTLTNTTELTAMFMNPDGSTCTDTLTITKMNVRDMKVNNLDGLVYTLYDDDWLKITGSVNANADASMWDIYDHREGIMIPNNIRLASRYAKDNKWTVEWAASGKPSSIYLSASYPSNVDNYNAYTGVFVTRLVNFAAIDCSEVQYVTFQGQWHMTGANLRSINLSVNKLDINPGAEYQCPLRLNTMHDLDALDVRNWDLSKIKFFSGFIARCESLKIVKLGTLRPCYTALMFIACHELETIEIDELLYTNPPDFASGSYAKSVMYSMFEECYKLKDINIRIYDYSKVDDINSLFFNCREIEDSATQMLADILSTGSRKSLMRVFRNCWNLRDLSKISDIDLSETTSLSQTFYGCINLVDVSPISGWNVSNVYVFDEMFFGCDKLRVISPLRNWDIFLTRRYHDSSGEQYEYQKMSVSLGSMFARSPKAAYINDGYASTHILDAENLTWAGYKQYGYDMWDAFVADGLEGSAIRFGAGVGATDVSGPGWPGSNYYEIGWDFNTIAYYPGAMDAQWEDVPRNTRYPYNFLGGTCINTRGDSAYMTEHGRWLVNDGGLYTYTKLKYPVPEWFLWFLNWNYNRNLPYGSDREACWNGDRDINPNI